MATILALFEEEFDRLSPRQMGMMRLYAEAQEREQAAMVGGQRVTCDPSNLARIAMSRTANDEEWMLRLYLTALNVRHLTRNDPRDPNGPNPTPLEAALLCLKCALQAIALLDALQYDIDNGIRTTMPHTTFVVMFTAIRPVCNDEYFDRLWEGFMQSMETRRFSQRSLDFFAGQYDLIFNKYADESDDGETSDTTVSGGDSTE